MTRTEIKNRWGKAATYLGVGLVLIAGGAYIHDIDERSRSTAERVDLLSRRQSFFEQEQNRALQKECQEAFSGSFDKNRLDILCASLVLEFDDSRPR